MLTVCIESVGIASPGLPDWEQAKPVLRGDTPWTPIPLEKYKPELLPANEKRRATELVRMAFRVCEQVVAGTTIAPSSWASVFASSGGDYPIIDQISRSLCEDERLVSPTQFHNSVHNSAAGYWSIATESRAASTSLSAFDDSFCAGLIEAMCLCHANAEPTLLAVYDIVPPAPLHAKRPITTEFGAGFLLTPSPTAQTLATITLHTASVSEASANEERWASLIASNPSARALPLLVALANKASRDISLATSTQTYRLQVVC
jgi:hypothetical protein